MGLLARILPIVDELTSAKAGVEETLRQITYTQDREAVRTQLREAAAQAQKAATGLSNLARAIESGFGTLPEESVGEEVVADVGSDVPAAEGDRDA